MGQFKKRVMVEDSMRQNITLWVSEVLREVGVSEAKLENDVRETLKRMCKDRAAWHMQNINSIVKAYTSDTIEVMLENDRYRAAIAALLSEFVKEHKPQELVNEQE